MTTVRPATPEDLDTIHQINDDNLPHVNRVSRQWFEHFGLRAPYFKVVETEGQIAAFLLGLTQDVTYDSLNFLWFADHYPEFVYVDRIVTAAWGRRRGAAGSLYRDLIDYSQPLAPVLTCEVNLRPPNPGSIAFHERFGFKQVGTQDTEGGKKTVSLMALDLTED